MPTYEYECSKCGAKFEMIQSMSEPAKKRVKNELKACTCDAPVTRRIGTGAGVIFKGSGFYQTDYRSESYKQAARADKESSDGKKESPDGKASKDTSDAKPGKDSAAAPAAKGDKPPSSSAESKATKNESAGHPKSQAKKSSRPKKGA